ncbi:MAG TPA: DUF2203 domain-containing protein [Verrucomicrobiae bacterium]|nr:DUF2203 domain-containing protein [Verrucomicrobiae bacterium]
MAHRFNKHYTRQEARKLLPQLRQWLRQLVDQRETLQQYERRLETLRKPGCDLGGPEVNGWVRTLLSIQDVLLRFFQRDIQIKDLDRGLLDFPAMRDGQEVFLCWEQTEDDVEFWHDLEAGYAGRKPLDEDV